MTRILVIDDDEQFRCAIGEMLAQSHFNVVLAADAEDGLRIFRSEAVDLVIVDIWMPEKDGLETLMELRRIDPKAKVIAISGGGRLGLLKPLTWASLMGAK